MVASTLTDLAVFISALAALVAAIGSIITVLVGRKNKETIGEVHDKVEGK